MTSKSLPGEEPIDDLPTDDLPTDDLPSEERTVADATVTDGFAAAEFAADGTLPDDLDPPPFAGLPDDRDPPPFGGLPAPQWLSEGVQPIPPLPRPDWAQAPIQESPLPPPPFEPSPASQAQAPVPAPAFAMPPPGPPPLATEPEAGPRPPELEPYEPWRREKPVRQGPLVRPRVVLKVLAGVAALGLAAVAVTIVVMDSDSAPELKSGARPAGGLFKGAPSATSDGRTQELTGVAASGNTVVAVGGELGPGADRGQFLHSADGGRTFSLVPVKTTDGQEQFGEAIPEVVAASSTGWAAIGRHPGGVATWTSKDGQSWIRQPDAGSDVFDDDDRVTALIAAGKGFLAVGTWARDRDIAGAAPVLWQSSDGRRWDRRDGGRLDLGAGKGSLQLVNASFDGKTILLQGLFTKNPGKSNPGINRPSWFSYNGGRSWTPAKVPVLPGTSGLVIGGGPKGLVAVREVRKSSEVYGQAFTRGGGKWVKAGQIKAAGLRRLVRVAATDQGYVAVSAVPGGVALQRSADAVTWQDVGPVPFAGRSQILGAAATPELTAIVGRNAVETDTDAVLAVRDAAGTEIPVNLAKVAGALRPEQVVSTVTSSDGQLVAVGGAYGDASIWTSRDSERWVAAQASGSTFARRGPQRLLDVVKGGAGWLAVGFSGEGPRRPLVVTSPDARTWQATDGAGAFKAKSGTSLATISLATGPAGYVIVGEEGTSAAAWFSADLKSWERGKEGRSGDLTASSDDNQWMRAVAGGSFGYVAVGGRHDPDVREGPPGRPVFWTSADGRTWKRQELPLAREVYEGGLTHIQARGTTLVAVGTSVTKDGPRPLSYVSVDGGANWQETALPVPAGVSESRATAATVTGSGFAVTGALGRPGTADAVLWTSADGRTWKAEPLRGPELAGPGDQRLTGLASFQNRLVGVGVTTDYRGDQPTLWVGP